MIRITNASTRFATFGILGFFGFTVLSGKFELNLHSSKRVMQALCLSFALKYGFAHYAATL
ncbi:hypothetical protein [Aliivibrio fischeri]|uniref:hypothetical protein n=1 Tax=Aliivibrio fischeri TaxID=668 RepID=UPI0018F208C9|nr:hypothetical protein [Aliivibrio fischeri]USR97026.1 hypothetical protein AVFI_17715 [Aliivibrio fischeri ATCC 7744 = JCM 18803 = DSM 507]